MSVWELEYNDGKKGFLVSKIIGKSISENSGANQAIKKEYEGTKGEGSFDDVAKATYITGIHKEVAEMTKGIYESREKLKMKFREIKRNSKPLARIMNSLAHSI
jgi:hypothetical protein